MKPNADSLPQLFHKLPSNRLPGDAHRGAVSYVLRLARAAIAAFDFLLRIFLEIHEFTLDPRCILRSSRGQSRSAVQLPNRESAQELKPALKSDVLRD